jgi:hypothetical protein
MKWLARVSRPSSCKQQQQGKRCTCHHHQQTLVSGHRRSKPCH